MPTAAELLRSKVDGLTDIPDRWVAAILNIQPKIAQRLTRLMGDLTTVDGFIEQTPRNIATLTQILDDIHLYMTSGEYSEILGELRADMIAQQATSTAYLATLGEVAPSTFASATYAARRVQLVRQLANGIDEAVVSPIFETLLTGIQTKASYSELLTSVIDNITGTPQYDGRLLAYSRQLVTDTIAVTDRAFTEIVASDLGLEWYRYLGGRIDTTRCFCNERNGKFYHRKEIEAWGNKEDLGICGTTKGWAGMNRDTDSDTIFAYVGGYNCQHSLLPVSVFSVPKIAIQDAIEKGYYKPDAVTRRELGLMDVKPTASATINAVNKSGISTDIDLLKKEAGQYAKSIGVTGDVEIVINKGRDAGGGVGFGNVIDGKQYIKPTINITNNGTLSTDQLNQIVRHELTHIKQGQSNMFFMQKIEGSWNIMWDGKPYMKMSEYTRTVNGFSGKQGAAYRAKMYKKYREFPWEAEAHLAGDPFK